MPEGEQRSRTLSPLHFEANEMALSLSEAENALRAFTSDRVDAILGADGKPYLLRPAQEHLLEREQWLEAVVESSADVIIVVNHEGTILSQNRSVSRLLGYEPEDMIGTSLFKLICEEDLPEANTAFFNVIGGIQEFAAARFSHRSRDGTYRRVEATLGKFNGGKSPGVVFSMRPADRPSRDGIEAARRQDAIAQPPLQKDRFLAMLAHELRTPLMAVLLGIGEMNEDGRFAGAAPILAMMKRNIELQARLLEELADFTTIGQHKLRLRLGPIDAHEALRYVLEICRGEIAAARIDLLLDLRATEYLANADPLRLQQVMWNLMRNAIKFSPPGSTISIASSNETPGRLTLEFVDHGIGIEAAMLPLVFDPFEQAERVTNQNKYGGLGLGLFIAKGLTEAQGGTLVVSSEGLGHGATFRLSLELAPAAAASHDPLPIMVPGPPAALNQNPD